MIRPQALRRFPGATLFLVALVASLYGGGLNGQVAPPPSAPPADWGAVAINLEDVPYPHPVRFLDRTLFGQDVRIAYMDVAPVGEPNGRTVMLLHGGSYYGWYWKDTIEALRNEGYRVVVKDRLGWGRSSKPILPYNINLHAANTKAILGHLGITEAAVVGHSWGGTDGQPFRLPVSGDDDRARDGERNRSDGFTGGASLARTHRRKFDARPPATV